MSYGSADLLERNAGIQEAFYDFQNQNIAETVQALRSRPGSRAHGWLHETRACPVVELSVGDSCGFAGGGPAITHISVEIRQVLVKQHSLRAAGNGCRRCWRVTGTTHDSSALEPAVSSSALSSFNAF